MASTDRHAPSLQSLEALRGILSTYVLIGHARWLLWAGHAAWLLSNPPLWQFPFAYGGALFRFGREAVLVFFALSGFFIHLSYAAAPSGSGSPSFSATSFYRRRVHRLVPPYVFALAFTVGCDAIGRVIHPALYAGQTGEGLLDATMARSGYTLSSIAPALVMLPSATEHHFGTNGPLWSLAYEVVYYAAYPAWLMLRVRSRLLAMVGVPLACFIAFPWIPQPFVASVTVFYPLWISGAWLAESISSRPHGTLRSGAAVAGAAAFLIYLRSATTIVQVPAAIVVAGAIVFWFATWPFTPTLLSRMLSYLGTRSFSIYILHFPVLALIAAIQYRLLGGRPMNGLLAASGAVTAIIVCCVGFWVCERHFLHRRPPLAERAAP